MRCSTWSRPSTTSRPGSTSLGVVADHADHDAAGPAGHRAARLGRPPRRRRHRRRADADARRGGGRAIRPAALALADRLTAAGFGVAPALVHPAATVGGRRPTRRRRGAGRRRPGHDERHHRRATCRSTWPPWCPTTRVIGDHATLSPGVLVNGSVHVGEGAFLGTGAIVTPGPHRSVPWAVIGAGAVVVATCPRASPRPACPPAGPEGRAAQRPVVDRLDLDARPPGREPAGRRRRRRPTAGAARRDRRPGRRWHRPAAAGRRTGTSRPDVPSSMASASPPTRVATTGTPAASASMTATGMPSWCEASTNRSAAAVRRGASGR